MISSRNSRLACAACSRYWRAIRSLTSSRSICRRRLSSSASARCPLLAASSAAMISRSSASLPISCMTRRPNKPFWVMTCMLPRLARCAACAIATASALASPCINICPNAEEGCGIPPDPPPLPVGVPELPSVGGGRALLGLLLDPLSPLCASEDNRLLVKKRAKVSSSRRLSSLVFASASPSVSCSRSRDA